MIGTGILKGMAVTARNFVGSYFDKERLITVQYPEERDPLPENYRNFPFLVYDGDDPNAGLRCVACKICEKECPPQCIYIIKSEDKKPDYMGKPQFYPKVFDIDISVCMSCQICVEVCPFEAIKMDKDFELSKRERFDALLLRKEELSKSNEYYHRIHPIDAATPYDRQMARIEPTLTARSGHAIDRLSFALINQWMIELRSMPYRYSREWRTPSEVEAMRMGDCKGKALTLYDRMQLNGARNVRFVIGKRR